MRIAANTKEEMEEREFTPIPVGSYNVRVLEVTEKQGPKGPYWNLKLEIDGGEYDGKFLFDRLFFSPKALNRFFLVFKRLTGIELDPTKDLDVQESDLIGCKAKVTVIHKQEEYEGKMITKAVVPFDGYESLDPNYKHAEKKKPAKKAESKIDLDDDIPDF